MQKCRACFKSSTKTYPLTKPVTECTPNKTYAQLLKEYAKFEFITNYECYLPQHLCFLCCNQLKNTHIFIEQVQHCNAKLINNLAKQLCLQEQVIDLPNEQNEEALVYIQTENPNNHSDLGYQDIGNFIANENDSNNENNSVTNESFIAEPVIKTEQIVAYDAQYSAITDESSFNAKTEENNIVLTIKEEEEGFLSQEIKNQESNESLLEPASFKNPSKRKTSSKKQTLTSEKFPDQYTNATVKKFPCKLCDYIARSASGLHFHKRSKHPTECKTHKCNFCSYTTLDKHKLLINHIKTAHKEQIKTLKANATSNADKSITCSIENKTNDNCSTNDMKTAPTEEESILENNNNKQDKKELTDEEFIKNLLNIKKRSTTSAFVIRCEECGKIYSNAYKLKDHQREVHKSVDKYWSCPYCDRKCKRKDGLKYHIRNAHGPPENKPQPKPRSKEKRFMCAECSYTCLTSTILKIHIRVHHTGERPYKCDMCEKSFVKGNYLTRHRYTHTGEKPYKCSVCLKDFRDPSHMRRHMRLHTNKTPFKCDDCGKSFTQKYSLSVHKRKHLKENKLDCSVCGKCFENNSMLNIHQINENHYDEVA